MAAALEEPIRTNFRDDPPSQAAAGALRRAIRRRSGRIRRMTTAISGYKSPCGPSWDRIERQATRPEQLATKEGEA
jgi:hypothetical protein